MHASHLDRAPLPPDMTAENEMRFMPIGSTAEREVVAYPEPAEYQAFYTAYGECFSTWSEVETSLLAIFLTVLKSPDYPALSSAFYSATGFRAKLDLVDAVVTNAESIGDDERNLWASLRQTASKSSLRRNQLAHDTVFYGRLSEKEGRKLFIGYPRLPHAKARLHTHDLKQISVSFHSLSSELFAFWQRLLASAPKP